VELPAVQLSGKNSRATRGEKAGKKEKDPWGEGGEGLIDPRKALKEEVREDWVLSQESEKKHWQGKRAGKGPPTLNEEKGGASRVTRAKKWEK